MAAAECRGSDRGSRVPDAAALVAAALEAAGAAASVVAAAAADKADSAAKAVILDLRQGWALPDFLSLRVMQNKVVGRCV